MGLFDLFRKKRKENEGEKEESLNFKPKEVKNEQMEKTETVTPPIKETIEKPKEPEKPKSRAFPRETEGKTIKYHYDQVNVFTPKEYEIEFEKLDPGIDIELRQEPENKYDSRAVAVYAGELKLGYLYKGKLQDMANDYIDRKCPILGCVDSVLDEEEKCTVALFFYAEKEILGVFKLTGTGSNARQEAAALLTEGSVLIIEYDYDKEKYEVIDLDPIGYLPKTAEKYAAEEDVLCVVDHLELDDNLKNVVYVRLEK